MQHLKLLVPLAFLMSAFFIACHEEDSPNAVKLADVTFTGRVIDEDGNGVVNALVSAGDEVATTDENGVFRLKPVRLNTVHAVVSVRKAGFFEVSRPYVVEDEALQIVTIQLMKKMLAGSVSVAGGTVNVPGGPQLIFPPNAVADVNGNPYTGTVQVLARYLDPNDPKLGLFMPGDMSADDASGNEVFLATYGMIGVEIESTTGQKLKIASGQEVEIHMPIASNQAASAPASIPLWHYELADGRWKEEGAAQKVGNEYVGKVKHFSFWNCDAPFPITYLRGRVFLDSDKQPFINAIVRITILSNGSQNYGYTDFSGYFGGGIPIGEPMLLEVMNYDQCGNQVLYAANIGPYSTETALPSITVTLPSSDLFVFSGRLVTCNGQPVSNGYARLEFDNGQIMAYANASGEFHYEVPKCGFTPGVTAEVTGYDLSNLLTSVPVPYTVSGSLDVGDVFVCNALAEYIEYAVDGQSIIIANPSGSVIPDSLPGSQNYYVRISGVGVSPTYISISYTNVGNQTGTFSITDFAVNGIEVNIGASTLSTTVTNAATNVGDMMVGAFGGTAVDFQGVNHTVTGIYRVKRGF